MTCPVCKSPNVKCLGMLRKRIYECGACKFQWTEGK